MPAPKASVRETLQNRAVACPDLQNRRRRERAAHRPNIRRFVNGPQLAPRGNVLHVVLVVVALKLRIDANCFHRELLAAALICSPSARCQGCLVIGQATPCDRIPAEKLSHAARTYVAQLTAIVSIAQQSYLFRK